MTQFFHCSAVKPANKDAIFLGIRPISLGIELKKADLLLLKFCKKVQELYGPPQTCIFIVILLNVLEIMAVSTAFDCFHMSATMAFLVATEQTKAILQSS